MVACAAAATCKFRHQVFETSGRNYEQETLLHSANANIIYCPCNNQAELPKIVDGRNYGPVGR